MCRWGCRVRKTTRLGKHLSGKQQTSSGTDRSLAQALILGCPNPYCVCTFVAGTDARVISSGRPLGSCYTYWHISPAARLPQCPGPRQDPSLHVCLRSMPYLRNRATRASRSALRYCARPNCLFGAFRLCNCRFSTCSCVRSVSHGHAKASTDSSIPRDGRRVIAQSGDKAEDVLDDTSQDSLTKERGASSSQGGNQDCAPHSNPVFAVAAACEDALERRRAEALAAPPDLHRMTDRCRCCWLRRDEQSRASQFQPVGR